MQVRHLEGVRRTAAQNAVAAKLLAATAVRGAAADAAAGVAGGGASSAGGAAGSAGALRQSAPAFKAQFDFKTALTSSIAHFYPAILLKS